jgi:phage/plasmid-associated DNA primase
MTEIVRNCTSGDSVLVEFKNQTPFNTSMRIKLFVASNSRPAFTSQAADTSRIIYIEVAPTSTKDDPDWKERLTLELPQFLWACHEAYQAFCPRGGDIALSERTRALTQDSVASFEERFLDVFEANFKAEPGARTKAASVMDVLRRQGWSNNEIGDFKTWLHQS